MNCKNSENKLRKDKRGIGNQIMLIIVMAIVLVSIILLIFVGQLVLPPLASTLQDSNTIIQETLSTSDNTDLQTAGAASFQPAADSLNNLEWVSYVMFIMMFLVFIIMCFYVRTYPFLLVIWILMIVVLLALSLYLAVVYQDLAQDETLGGYYTSWENTDYLLQNLPIIVLIMGIVGGIVMFILSSREQEAEIGGQYL